MPRNGSGVSSVVNTFVIDTVADPDEVNANFTDVADQLTNSLPRDGQAGMNAPLPLQNGTAALPALTFSSDTNTGIYRKAADSVGFSGNGLEIAYINPTGLFVNGAQVTGPVYATKSSGYTALATDRGATLRFTSTATLALTAAATLGSGWPLTIVADGGAVTIDPNASETINGLATLAIPDGSSATIVCDGSNFFTVIRPSPWVAIGAPVALSGQTNVDWTDLGAYRRLKLTLECQPSSASAILLRVSTNNGSSYLAGASDYLVSSLNQAATTVAGAASTLTTGYVLNTVNADANTQVTWTSELSNFNKNLICTHKSDGVYVNGGAFRRDFPYGFSSGTSARNALRLIVGTGNFAAGQVTLEGIRG